MATAPRVIFTKLAQNPNNGWRKQCWSEMPAAHSSQDQCKIIETVQGSALYDVEYVWYTGNPKQYWDSRLIISGVKLEDARRSARIALQDAWRIANPPTR